MGAYECTQYQQARLHPTRVCSASPKTSKHTGTHRGKVQRAQANAHDEGRSKDGTPPRQPRVNVKCLHIPHGHGDRANTSTFQGCGTTNTTTCEAHAHAHTHHTTHHTWSHHTWSHHTWCEFTCTRAPCHTPDCALKAVTALSMTSGDIASVSAAFASNDESTDKGSSGPVTPSTPTSGNTSECAGV